MKRTRAVRALILALVAAVLYVGSFASGYAQSPETASREQAKAILMGMAEFLSNTHTFSVDVMDNYDVLQNSGQKIEFGETRKITVVRPNQVRVEVEQSNGDRSLFTFDGKDLTVWSPTNNVYARTSRPGSIEDAVVYFVRDLKMRMPFAVLLLATAPAELERRTRRLDYVEKTRVDGIAAHHLAGRTESVDYQAWIADSDKPLLLRLVLTYPASESQPQFRAWFSNWNFTPETSPFMFTFTPPPGAQQITFLEQLPRSATKPQSKPIEPDRATKSRGQK